MSRLHEALLIAATVVVLVTVLTVVGRVRPARTWRRYWLYMSLNGLVLVGGAVAFAFVDVWATVAFLWAVPIAAIRPVRAWRRQRSGWLIR